MTATLKAESVDEILASARGLEAAKASMIEALRQEAIDLTVSTDRRQDEIKAQLKALGYKVSRPRKAKA